MVGMEGRGEPDGQASPQTERQPQGQAYRQMDGSVVHKEEERGHTDGQQCQEQELRVPL